MNEPVTDAEMDEALRQLPDCRYDEDYGNVAMKNDLFPRLISEVRRLRGEHVPAAAYTQCDLSLICSNCNKPDCPFCNG